MLKMDFRYKLPDKVKVYLSKGKSFSPFKCGVTMQNEDCLTMFWKFLTAAESIDAIKQDLLRLKERLAGLQNEPVRVIYVDNCCAVRDKLVEMFPGVLVKLDNFHWFCRWDDMLQNKTSEEANFFRHLMRRAMFVIEDTEKRRIRYLKPGIKDQEMYKLAKATIPPADLLIRRVEAVLNHVYLLDHETDCRSVDDLNPEGASGSDNPPRKQHLKPFDFRVKKGSRYATVRQLINNQLEHVRKGCLSDPPSEVVKIHRVNPRTGEAKSARGTGGNENQHRELNAVLDSPSVGIARAERIIDDCYEMSNDRKMVKRLGMKEQPTFRTDKLVFLNSLAQSCGFKDAQLPFDVSHPPSPLLVEYMGMSFELPEEFLPSKSAEEEEDDEEAGVNDMVQFLEGIDFDYEDIAIPPAHFTPRDETTTDAEIDSRRQEEDIFDEDLEPIEFETFEREVARALPSIIDKETTMEAWCRLTQGKPIVPFKNPSLPLTDLDRAEHALFDELQTNYSRHSAYLGGVRGYKRFENEWNQHVANRFRERLTALDGSSNKVQIIHRKTYLHLRDHFDNLESQKRTWSLVRPHDPARERLDRTLQHNRRLLAPHQEAHNCTPVAYNYSNNNGLPHFGNPTTLNANIAANAFTFNQQHRNGTVPFNYNVQNHTVLSVVNGFKNNTHCFRCGWRKRDHREHPFGQKCTGNIGRDECSKCFTRLEFHCIGEIGPHCHKTAHKNSNFPDWYTVRDI